MMKWIILIIATEAITEILVHADILNGPRNLLKKVGFFKGLLSCGWCLSFWVAIGTFALFYSGLKVLLYPIVIHRVSNYLHFGYSILKSIRWRA